ncbi:helix-turn-helix domain-containing protein [Euzebya rosea]|uniref:helix-turn-helix domain-containing protein n=1 Tax=Euzebya rosea TaxID=2052804 RepID=UPI0013006DDC|nr:helix-turn-helix transcriptional regulator [Euzebya rosea]
MADRRFDPDRACTSQRYLWDLARALHDGHDWPAIAERLGVPVRAYRSFYRPRVASYCLRLLPDADGHGTLAGYSRGGCHPDGRRCEPCLAAKAAHLRRARNRAPIRTDPAFLAGLARRLVDGESWEAIAIEMGRSRGHLQDRVRQLVQPWCLQLIEAEQPSTSHRAHGTYVKSVQDDCRCECCRYANVVYERDRQLRHRRGTHDLVDADPVRARLAELAADGIGLKQVARLSGVSHGALSKLVHGQSGRPPSRRCRTATAERIMAVTASLDDLADGALVDATITHARIADLLAAGATRPWIASRIAGRPVPSLQLGRSTVTARNARAVRDLHTAVVVAGDVVPGEHHRPLAEVRQLALGRPALPAGWTHRREAIGA